MEKDKKTKRIGLDNSHLIRKDDASKEFERLELSMPYLVMYEMTNPETDTSIYQEYSEVDRVILSSTYQKFLDLGKMKLHSHDFYEMTFVLSGSLTMQIENEILEYKAGDCVLCNKNIHHKEIMDKETEIVLFLMKEDFILNVLENNVFYDDKGDAHPKNTLFSKLFLENNKNPFYDAKVYIDFHKQENDCIEDFFVVINSIIKEITGQHSGKSHIIKGQMCRLLELLEDGELMQSAIHEATLSNEEQVIHKLATAYKDKNGVFSRAEVEAITGYNSDYVERIVKKKTGYTLSAYGKQFLLKKAAFMLKETKLGIGEICENLGYSNRYYFNQMFKNEYGMLPSEFRKMGF